MNLVLELHRLLMYRKPLRSDAAKLATTALRRITEAYAIVFPTQEDAEAGLILLTRFGDQKITLADATIASMAARFAATVMTLDSYHFGLVGTEVYQ
ncbi:hypothetical protein BH24DEI2_BH24DEI2_20380 [soil metagenome]